jgi:hypothetical protein
MITRKNEKTWIIEYAAGNYNSTEELETSKDGVEVLGSQISFEELLSSLSDCERMEIFSNFCAHCGTPHLPCHCWNDE